MHRYFRWIGLICVVFLVGCFFSWTAPSTQGFSLGQASQVKLFAYSAKKTYARSELITLLLILKNTGASPVGLSPQISGTVQVKSFKKDGVALPTRTSFVLAYEDLSYLLQKSLLTVHPNQSIPVLWTSEPDPESGNPELSTIQLNQEGINQVTYYSVGAPGVYELTFTYEIPNLPNLASSVFHGATNEATLTFQVLP
jgi:hypothetical protein